MTIKSLQYAKVNKGKKNLDDVDLNPADPGLTEPADLHDDHGKRLECKDLTLEEILHLETDKEVNN